MLSKVLAIVALMCMVNLPIKLNQYGQTINDLYPLSVLVANVLLVISAGFLLIRMVVQIKNTPALNPSTAAKAYKVLADNQKPDALKIPSHLSRIRAFKQWPTKRIPKNTIQKMIREVEGLAADLDAPLTYTNLTETPRFLELRFRPGHTKNGGIVRISKLTSALQDFRRILQSKTVDFAGTIDGTDEVAFIIPTDSESKLSMPDIILSEAYQDACTYSDSGQLLTLPVAMGMDTSGLPIILDIAQAPHILVGGASGSGKSVWQLATLASLHILHNANSLELILVDMKRTDMLPFKSSPLVTAIHTEIEDIVEAINSLVIEMGRRNKAREEVGANDFMDYHLNKMGPPMPRLLLVIDEYSELVDAGGQEFKAAQQGLTRLVKMGRAAGIHVVISTQRPDSDTIDGQIRTSTPTRIGFRVGNSDDSRVVLGNGGAEKLGGKGDGLLKFEGNTTRFQGVYVEKSEVIKLLKAIKNE